MQLAIAIALIGGVFSAFICGVGHLVAFMVLEGSFAPPLLAQENMGQFGFLTVYVGFFGGIVGISLGVIPYIRFIGWLPVFLLVIFIAAVAEPMDFSTTAGFAMLFVGLAMLMIGLLTSVGCRILLR